MIAVTLPMPRVYVGAVFTRDDSSAIWVTLVGTYEAVRADAACYARRHCLDFEPIPAALTQTLYPPVLLHGGLSAWVIILELPAPSAEAAKP